MSTSLTIHLRAIGDQILVDVAYPAGGQAGHQTTAPFSGTQLVVLLRALEISRSVRDTFDRAEWTQLEAWQVAAASFTPTESDEMRATEGEILSAPLLTLVQTRLYELLFGAEPIRQILHLALSQVQPREALHLELHLPPGNRAEELLLSQYPWEVLSDTLPYWPNKRVVISRYIQLPQGALPPETVDRLRVLVITARPGDLSVGQGNDAASMVAGLQRRLAQFPVQVRELPRATFDALSDYLYEFDAWHVLHFDGHGDFGRVCPAGHLNVNAAAKRCAKDGCGQPLPAEFTGYLAFERPDGQADWVSAAQLADLLVGRGLRLVMLNACNSAVGRRGETVFNGLAQSLIRAGISAVVATPFRLDWEAAVEMARNLYQHLGQGEPLVEALDHSRRRLRHQRTMPREWYRPVLYLRQKDDSRGNLFSSPTDTTITRPDQEALQTLQIYSFQPAPPHPPERAFFWGRYFDKNRQSQRQTPDPQTWDRELMPELRERKEEIGELGTIYCPTRLPLSVGLAVGHVFPQVAGFRLGVMQQPPAYYFSDAIPPADTPFQPVWEEFPLPGNDQSKESLLIIRATRGRDWPAMVAAIGQYWQEETMISQLLEHGRPITPSRKFRQVMLLQAEPAVGTGRFLEEWEIAQLAFASRIHLDRLARPVETVHLILAAPESMATFLGHQWNAINTTLQFHEWVGGDAEYLPSVRLPLA